MPEKRMCPQCGSFDTFRSHRRLIEYLLVVFKPFRCRSCRHRFYAYQTAEPSRQTGSDE
jgi:rubredoxin